MAIVHDKYLVKMEKILNLWTENMNENHVLIDSDMLHQKVLSLYEDFSKESHQTSDNKPFYWK